MKPQVAPRVRHLAGLWAAGATILALATWSCFRIGLGEGATGFVFLMIVVLLSLFDSFISSAIFSAIAVGCLNYFFTEPLYSLDVTDPRDAVALIAFLVTSLAITSLVRRVKRAGEIQRRTQETFLAEAQQLSHTGSFGWNLVTGGISWSDETFRIFGYESDVAPSIPLVMQRVHPEDYARVSEVIDRAARDRQDFDFEFRLLMPDATVKHIHAVGHVRDGPDKRQIMGALMDVTAQREAERALQESEQRYRQVQADFARAARISMLGELAASIGHEINQPLGAVTANAEAALRWLVRPEPDVRRAEELTHRIVADARRANEVIMRMRTMAAGRAPQRSALSLEDVIRESMLFLRHEIQQKGVTVALELAPALPEVSGDRTQLQQVVVNLCINAVQAMTQPGMERRKLRIHTNVEESGLVRCTLEDSGPGIRPASLEHLFDSFFTTKEAGMGLGLPISRSIIEAHGGRIHADNGSALGGARFTIELPAQGSA